MSFPLGKLRRYQTNKRQNEASKLIKESLEMGIKCTHHFEMRCIEKAGQFLCDDNSPVEACEQVFNICKEETNDAVVAQEYVKLQRLKQGYGG